MNNLKISDPKIYRLIKKEMERQEKGLVMIPSENMTSLSVLEAMGTCLSNKYSEGLPQKRYYSGNQYIDQIESLAIARAKKLFGAEHANVQPHSGAQANQAAYLAVLEKGDRVLAMGLDQGGHLTHGSAVNFSGKFYHFIHYQVKRETGYIDYDQVEDLAKKYRPKLILAGASAYPRVIDFKKFREISDRVGAYLMADIAHIAGLIVGRVHPDPFPFADIVTSTTHKTLRGPRGGLILSKIEDRLKPQDKKKLFQKIDSAVFPGCQGGPLEHIIAAKAVCFKEASTRKFAQYQKQIVKNAKALAQVLLAEGFDLISGGTDNHLILVDLTNMGLTGKEAQEALEAVGIYVNKNIIPYDRRSPLDPSGIRLGTPALTTRGFKEKEMEIVGRLIARVLKNIKSQKIKKEIMRAVEELTKKYPFYLV